MVISDKHKFVFVHIPKCGGTYVRNAISSFDETGGYFTSKVGFHEVIGELDYVHIPLEILEKYFPDEYGKLLSYKTYAVVRNPLERFPSSIAQHIKYNGDNNIQRLKKHEVRSAVDAVISWISDNRGALVYPPEYIHFQPQVDYIYNKSMKVSDAIYTLENAAKLIGDIENRAGVKIDKITSGSDIAKNESFTYRYEMYRNIFELIRPLYTSLGKSILTDSAVSSIKGVVFVPQRDKLKQIFSSEYVRDFVQDEYKMDMDLYEKVKSDESNLEEVYPT